MAARSLTSHLNAVVHISLIYFLALFAGINAKFRVYVFLAPRVTWTGDEKADVFFAVLFVAFATQPIQSIEIMYYLPADATKEIKRRLRNGADIVIVPHARTQMMDRCIDDLEVSTAIRSGVVSTPAELKDDEYRYKIESNLNGGIAVVLEMPEENPNIIIITTFRPKKKNTRKL